MRELYFEKEIPQKLKDTLNRLLNSSERVTLDYGDVKTGRSWGEDYDITGRVGRTTGTKQIAILVHNARSMGGGAILTDCILSIRHANKRDGGYIYKL